MKHLTKILLCISIFVIAFLSWKSCESKKEYEGTINFLTEELDTTRNELNQQNAKNSVLELKKRKDFLKIKSKDETINWLQEVVKDYKGRLNTALVIANETKSKGKTKTILKTDTVDNNIFENYYTEWDTEWEKGWICAGKDSIEREVKFKNKYQVTFGKESNKWFKRKEYKVNVLNLNPNTYTTEMKSFSIKEKPKRFTLSLQLGAGLNLLTMKPAVYIGAGAGFTIIGVK